MRVDVLGRQLALPPLGVQPALEVVEGDLPHHGVDHVLDLRGQQDLPRGLILRPVQQPAEGQHLAEDARRLRQRQRRRGQQLPLPRRQPLVHPVPELVRQRHHVAALAEVVEQHVGMHVHHRRMREGPRRLPRLHPGVDPAPLEERPREVRHARIEAGVGVEHRRLRLLPADLPVVLARKRRVAVPDLQLVEPEPPRLQRIVAVRELGIGRDHRVAQRLDHLGLHVVREVPRGLRRRELPPAVLDLLLLGERVGDPREERQPAGEGRRQRLRRRLPLRPVAVGEEVERRLEASASRRRPGSRAPPSSRRRAGSRPPPPPPTGRAGTSPARRRAGRASSCGCGRAPACSAPAPRPRPPPGRGRHRRSG